MVETEVDMVSAVPLLVLLLAQPARDASPATAPTSQPAAPPITRPSELDGAYLEVIATPSGLRRTQRCGLDDQLILESAGRAFRVRWSGAPVARSYTDPPLVDGALLLKERRRTMRIARQADGTLRIDFERADGRRRTYLYDRVERVQALPQIVVDDDGCAY